MTAAAGPGAASGRDLARAVLLRVEREGAFASRALAAALDRAPAMSAPDRGLATELVYGVLRRRARLDRAIAALARKGIEALDVEVRVALRVGAYQLLFLDRVPAYAAVSDAVEACKRASGRGAAGFANAVLRKLAREGEGPLPDAGSDPAAFLELAVGFPPWLARLALAELPAAEAIAFGEASVATPPVGLRGNTARIDRDALIDRLRSERPDAALAASAIAPDAVLARGLEAPAATGAWRAGLFAVQDAGAQVIAELCGAAPGERILDACAGIGGKTAHLMALAGGRAQVDAADVSDAKLREANQTLARLGLPAARALVADLTQPLADPSLRYDRVLLDAPCSGLGVLRRHPEALLRRSPADLAALASAQQRMLRALAPAVRPGGLLVYAVCTFDRASARRSWPTSCANGQASRSSPRRRPGDSCPGSGSW